MVEGGCRVRVRVVGDEERFIFVRAGEVFMGERERSFARRLSAEWRRWRVAAGKRREDGMRSLLG
jgi:hypothetical protein